MIRIQIVIALGFAVPFGIASPQTAADKTSYPMRITGRVVDPTKMPLPKTSVSLTGVRTGATRAIALTDVDGVFIFDSVLPGQYVLRFEEQGFLSRRLKLSKSANDHEVNVGIVELEIGEVAEGPLFLVKQPKGEKPYTVCELLAKQKKLRGKPVAVVGRIECGSSLIDHVCFLAEDRCEQPITTDGFSWPNKVYIEDSWEEGMPKPPSSAPEIDRNALLKKLSMVRKTTALALHKEPRFKAEGRAAAFSHLADVKDEWGIAYGIFFTAPKLKKDGCSDDLGCGGFDGAPVALITLPNALHPVDDEKRR